MLILRDVTAIASAARRQLVSGCAVYASVSGALIAFFFLLLGRIQVDLRRRSRLLAEANERLEAEVGERTGAQAELERALTAAEVAAKAKDEALTAREAALGELRAAKVDLEQQIQTIERQQIAIRELAAPIIDVWNGLLTLPVVGPVVGPVDASRAADMTERLLHRINEAQARWGILDLTGLPSVDGAITEHLARMAKAARLLGCGCVVTGLSPLVARAFVEIGVDLDDVLLMRTLKEGIKHCLSRAGRT